jgi:hypothetical protein
MWHQLDQAYHNGADQVWIFNVGDIKPMEVPLTFAMTVAWNMKTLQISQLPKFFDVFVETTFNDDHEIAQKCSHLFLRYMSILSMNGESWLHKLRHGSRFRP